MAFIGGELLTVAGREATMRSYMSPGAGGDWTVSQKTDSTELVKGQQTSDMNIKT